MANKRRFRRDAVASSDGVHIRIAHDRRAGTTGRTTKRIFVKCGSIKVQVTEVQAKMLAPCQLIFAL
jgi:hypothetical protein